MQKWNPAVPVSRSGLDAQRRQPWRNNRNHLIKLASFLFIAVTNQNEKIYVFIPDLKTWTSAQAYCRKHYTDLSMIENIVENKEVYSLKSPTSSSWIGLYREPWTWSDNSQSTFRSWRDTSPNNYYGNQFCMVENEQHKWDDANCQSKYPFICHQGELFDKIQRFFWVLSIKVQSMCLFVLWPNVCLTVQFQNLRPEWGWRFRLALTWPIQLRAPRSCSR